MNDQTVRAPSADEELLIGEASRFSPSKSMERLDTHAKYLFSTVTVFGTLIAAFDLYKPGASAWLLVPVVLVAVSLGCAIIAITPKYFAINIDDLDALAEHYTSLLRRRGTYIRAAGILFSLALITTPLVLQNNLLRHVPVTSTSSLKISRNDHGDAANLQVGLTNLPNGSTLTVTLQRDSPGPLATLAAYTQRHTGTEVKTEIEAPIRTSDVLSAHNLVTYDRETIFSEDFTIAELVPPKTTT
jgi:hypothetical protein